MSDLQAKGGSTDWIVIDLVDERLGVYPYSNGGFLTFSNELNQSRLMPQMKGRGPFITFGTDEHFELWTKAADILCATIDRIGALYEVRLIEAPFVHETDTGSSREITRGTTAAEWNGL
ncbi:hypothetical protein J2T21_003870 [Paeniglutamicibacter psychrophenolicus]|nr:hypothetical protein [Paeniglutamicibacter psychrophenolicus]